MTIYNDSKIILFDLDGTLLDTVVDLAQALSTLLHENNLPLPDNITTLNEFSDYLRPHVSHGAKQMVRVSFGENYHDDLIPRFVELYYADISKHTQLFPGMLEILDKLDEQKIKWGIVTNKGTKSTDKLLTELGLKHRAHCIVCGDTLHVGKPSPEPLWYACEITASEPDASWFIGDSVVDITAGKNANIRTILVMFGYVPDREKALKEWQPTQYVEKPQDLLKWII